MSSWKNTPFEIEVKQGETKAFCMCGLSKNAPFCDGSHETTDIMPQLVTFEEDKTIYACRCQQSAQRPFCDGTHTKIEEDDSNN